MATSIRRGRRRRRIDRLSAGRIMTSPVALASEDDPIRLAAQVMARRKVSAVAVLNAKREVTGVITASDIVRLEPSHRCTVTSGGKGFRIRCIGDRLISDAMRRGIVSVRPDASIEDLARAMIGNRVHRVFVASRGRLVGVVSALDLARVLAQCASLSKGPARAEWGM